MPRERAVRQQKKDVRKEENMIGRNGGTKGDTMEDFVSRALELGAEKAKIIDTATVAVAEWVRWKCMYGCQFYEKDTYPRSSLQLCHISSGIQ